MTNTPFLQGNIRVFCRVRPVLSEEFCPVTPIDSILFLYDDDERKKLIIRKQPEASKAGQEFKFEFDRVFRPESTQSEVFEEISQLVHVSKIG
jgi:kinesin family protein C1